MKMFLLGFLVCYIISSVVMYIADPIEEWIARIYMAPAIGVFFIICWPFCFFYHVFLRLTIKPIETQRIVRVAKISKGYHVWRLFGNVYFYYDKHARIINKLFFLRSVDRLKLEKGQIIG